MASHTVRQDPLVGRELGHYRIAEKIGEGGMGVVYRAHDERLDRYVAIKVLPGASFSDPNARARLLREARTASRLNHPNICTIYEIGEAGGQAYIAMELVTGQALSARLAAGPLRRDEILRYGIQISEALAHAHEHRVVHRDLKSGNVVITIEGSAKVLDFGLAKQLSVSEAEEITRTQTSLTAPGVMVGTLAYMAPERINGQPADVRSDIWALGVVLYEMLTRQAPFQASSRAGLISVILRDPPARPKELRADTPAELQRIVLRCLEKEPGKRYASAADVARDCTLCQEHLAAAQRRALVLKRPAVVAILATLFVAAALAIFFGFRGAGARWARNKALPEITRLTESGRLYEAYRMILAAQKHLPGDPRLQEAFNRITLPMPINTKPQGAELYVNSYASPQAPWEFLGRTPFKEIRFPYGMMRVRLVKPGYETYEGAPFGTTPIGELINGFPLDPVNAHPAGMVRVPGGNFAPADFPAVVLDDYWIDKYEVTNRQFKQFVDGGGYAKREYWTGPFVNDGHELSWEDAMNILRDSTGRPGPATWELSTYPEGRDEFPVGGVSWYEAVAYCQSLGKTLPTVYHWYKAAAQEQLSDILRFSNFDIGGPARVGSYGGLGAYGTYDMAGNVKEWVWNATAGKRYILGGSWGEPTYQFLNPDARRPFERAPNQGIRCARYSAPLPAAQLAPVTPLRQGFIRTKPISDELFNTYRKIYAYERSELRAKLESVDDNSPYWRKEKVLFAAAYGGERVPAYIFLPRNAAPPFQTVVWFPGDDVFLSTSSDKLASAYLFDFIPRGGRALVYPVYSGMYERARTKPGDQRGAMIQWYKDLGRTLDYLQTRPDIDSQRFAYYGFSSGADYGPLFGALDPRFKASVLLAGGAPSPAAPEIDVFNFATRFRVPTLMINGRDDFLAPLELSGPFFRLLGTPERDKRHVLVDGGHLPSDRAGLIREVLGWLDRYLGPVRPVRPASTVPTSASATQ